MYKRDEIIKDLRDFVAEVRFTKVDGTRRIMKCTLMPSFLPNYDEKYMQEQYAKDEYKDIVVVWDIQAKGWRSFHVDSIESIQILDNW